MGEGFLKFKRQLTLHALIKGLSVGISVGLTAFGSLFLLSKREVIALELLFCVLIGVGAFLATGAAVYFIFAPTEKRLAKRLDKELVFNEKVQTMIAFKEDDREMVALQRQDTEERLRNTPLSSVKFGRIWQYAVSGALALAIFVTSLVVPPIVHVPVDPPFDLSNWQKLRLENLIEDVEVSDMVTDAKSYVVEQLEALIFDLDNAEKESVMKTHVVDVIAKVDGKVDKVNSYGAIRKALGSTGDGDLIKLANAVKALQESASVQAFEEVRPLFVYDSFETAVLTFNGKVSAALTYSSHEATDELYASIVVFMNELKALSDGLENYTADTLNIALNGENGVGGLFTEFAVEAHAALTQQKVNRRTSDYVIAELMEIFMISADELPDLGEEELDYKLDEDDGKGEDETPPQDGGLGDGKTEYGSNDTIYDDEKGYVEYGTVLDKYFAQMNEQLLNGTLPKEVEEFIRDYFEALYGSNDTDGQ